MKPARYGAIEAGGTKILCGVTGEDGRWLARDKFSTAEPEQNLAELIGFFSQHPVNSLGLASFGPLDIDPTSLHYGRLLNTSKPHWSQFPFARRLADALNTDVVATTDVLAAAMAEQRFGAARGCDNFCYVTVGTGIGVGTFIAGKPLTGKHHPEPGHLPLIRNTQDNVASACPYHSHCAEGLASGPALSRRVPVPLTELAATAPLWELAADYLAQLCHSLMLCYQPDRIILGGGVMRAPHLLPMITNAFESQARNYAQSLTEQNLLVSALKNEAGLLGALALVHPLENVHVYT
ncbi:ROK family protein [Simiduia agarivorans]|uniref:Fructokinase n=1 Tax=Simiduia agarivorans (strain DSM 21679 / JCM 13881 / BCRC 17597 / SA1) TaxID=1117647 RepID=K4L2R6_SIMAS|nr:ROK family protein [Simiduia agarivorans]AFV00493.1 fructokinase [Simiduia agarivorans SA1 = DSM 21679]